MRATLVLPFPPSTNHYWRRCGSRTIISTAGKQFRVDVVRAVIEQFGEAVPFVGPVRCTVDLYQPDRRRRDLDNYDGKALFDALTKALVWEDDSQVRERTGRIHPKHDDFDVGACIISIEEIS